MQNSCILPCHAACTIAVHLRGAFYNKHSIPSSSQRVIFASDTANIHLSLNAGMLACTYIHRWTDNILLLLQPFISERGSCASSVPCFNFSPLQLLFMSIQASPVCVFHLALALTVSAVGPCQMVVHSEDINACTTFLGNQSGKPHWSSCAFSRTSVSYVFLMACSLIRLPTPLGKALLVPHQLLPFILERTTEVTCRVCRRPAKDVQS